MGESNVTDLDNQQWKEGDNIYRRVTLKGIDQDLVKDGALLAYDPVDDKWFVYLGTAATTTTAIFSYIPGEEFLFDGFTDATVTICIGGRVLQDYLAFPGAVAIDDRPNGALLSVREQLRQFGIIAVDVDQDFNENNITA